VIIIQAIATVTTTEVTFVDLAVVNNQVYIRWNFDDIFSCFRRASGLDDHIAISRCQS